MNTKTAFITGATGQDGTFLTQALLETGHTVFGMGKDTFQLNGIAVPSEKFPGQTAADVVKAIRPNQIYYLAAHHHSSQTAAAQDGTGFTDCLRTHAMTPATVLETIVRFCPGSRFFFASSSLIFGGDAQGTFSEISPRNPDGDYGLTKKMGMDIVRWYREQHGVHACSGILFNHESWLRKPDYLSRKVVNTAVKIYRGQEKELVVGDLSASADWGFAPDFVNAFIRVLAAETPKDYIIATGRLHSVRDWVIRAFSSLGLRWEEYVREDPSLMRRKKSPILGDISLIRADLGWEPRTSFETMVDIMLEKELLGE